MRKAFFIFFAATLGVAGCANVDHSMRDFFGYPHTAEQLAVASAWRAEYAAGESFEVVGERLAAYAQRCWVRDDPLYRVEGPVVDEESSAVTLVHLGEPSSDGDATAALVLKLSAGGANVIEAMGMGPLMTDAYQGTIDGGIRHAIATNEGCGGPVAEAGSEPDGTQTAAAE